MGNFLQDLKYGIRTLLKSPGFALTAILTLALGIGANTAIFTVVNSVLLRPLPYQQPDRLVILSERTDQFESGSVAYQNFTDWRDQSRSFDGMALFRNRDYTLTGERGPEHIHGREVSAGFFHLLGVPLTLGRDFTPDDDHEGSAPTIILTYGLWQRRFGGSPDVLGKILRINDRGYTVIGVAQNDFKFYNPTDLFMPIGVSGQMWLKNRMEREGAHGLARLKPGVSRTEAVAELDGIAKRLAVAYPEANAGHSVTIVPMRDDVVSDVRGSLIALALGVLFLMGIACANVANLLLSRVAPRQREFAIRTALGASRSRVAGQLLTESILLSLLGGILGIGLAWAGTRGLLSLMKSTLPPGQTIGLDWHVGLFIFVLCVATGVLFGLAPVWQSVRGNTNETLKDAGRGSSTGRHTLQNALVAAELGIAVLLLVGAGLTVRTMQKLAKVDPGFHPEQVLTFDIGFSKLRYDQPDKVRNMLNQVITRISAIPGVEAATMTTDVMVRDDSEAQFYVAERPKPQPKDLSWSMMYITSADYLKAMGIRQIRGRYLTEHDNLSSPGVVVIDEELARSLFPNQEPLGQHLVIPFPGFDQPREIVGVVQHVKHWGLSQDDTAKIKSQFYVPFSQIPDNLYSLVTGMTYAVRSRLDERAITAAVQDQLKGLDSDIPVYNIASMNEIVASSIATQRQISLLLGFFAVAALLLGAVGTYGVISYSVSQRTNEMGIRMALGAQRKDILGLVVTGGAKLVALGIAGGLLLSLFLTRFMASFLYGVKSTDPLTFGAVAFLLFSVAIVACVVPARRATKVDPMIALRYE
jgi:putative ABC transport system permease protein